MPATNSLIEQYEVVKEIHYVFENIEPKIKAKIYKIILGARAECSWEINYYCRINDEADVYIPGTSFGNNLNEIEHKLTQYIKRFEKAVGWRQNEFF